MEILKILTLSALISLSSSLTEGLKSFEQKKYDKAIEHLSVVIENKGDQRFKDIALFYRAQTFHAKGQIEKARSDIIELTKIYPSGEYTDLARKMYLEWGGKITELPPAMSLKQVLLKFAEFTSKNDFESAKTLGTERWNTFINDLLKCGSIHVLPLSFIIFSPSKEVYSEKEQLKIAQLLIDLPLNRLDLNDGPTVIIEFVLDTDKNSWLINDISGIIGNELKTEIAEFLNKNIDDPILSTIYKLKKIGRGFRMYFQEHNGAFPPSLDDLITGEYIKDQNIIFWTDKTNNKKARFMYRPGLTKNDDVDTIISASPAPTDGKREVLYLDGHVEVLPDEDFRKKAIQQGWKFSGLINKDEIPAEKQEEIKKIVRKLGDNDPKVRKEAKKQLSELGTEAFPILEEFVNDPDPEIKVNVKELLGN